MRLLRNVFIMLLSGIGFGILAGIAVSFIYYILLIVSGIVVPFWHAILYGVYLGSIAGFLLTGLTALIHGNRDKRSPVRVAIILLMVSPLYMFVFSVMSPDLMYFLFIFTSSLFASFLCIRLLLKDNIVDWLRKQFM